MPRRAAAAWAAAASFLAAGAFALTPADTGQRSYFCEDIRKPFFAETAPGSGLYAAARPQAMPEKFRMPKPAGTRRVFVIGESVAAILDQGSYALEPAGLSGWFRSVLPGGAAAPPEILNCGMGGYESYRISGVLKEVLGYSPDLVVLLSGNHEGSPEYLCPGLDFELRRRKLRLYERVFSLKHGPQRARKLASLRLHGEMLTAMAASARKAGVPLVLSTLPANFRDMPSRTPPAFENGLFAAGYLAYHRGRHAEAEKSLRAAARELPEDPHSRFYLARALEKLGRGREAAAYYAEAVSVDGDLTRADSERNALIRRAAAESGACLADLEGLFRGLAKDGLPGFAEFTDGMHWRRPLNRLVWDEIYRAAAACGLKEFSGLKASENRAWRETPRQDALVRLNYAASWMLGPGLLNEASLAELEHVRRLQPSLLKEITASQESFTAALKDVFWSAPMLPRAGEIFPSLLAHVAEVRRRAGDAGAAADLARRALSASPGHKGARFALAQALADLGKKEEAAAGFKALGEGVGGLAAAYGF